MSEEWIVRIHVGRGRPGQLVSSHFTSLKRRGTANRGRKPFQTKKGGEGCIIQSSESPLSQID